MSRSTLSPAAAERAAKELHETPENLRDKPDELRTALRAAAQEEKYADVGADLVKLAELGDGCQLRFLRLRKYDVALALENVVGYFRWIHAQQNVPTDVFSDVPMDPARLAVAERIDFWSMTARDARQVFSSGIIGVLPKRAKNGECVMYVRDIAALVAQMQEYPVRQFVLSIQYFMDKLSLDADTQVCGLSIVEDLSGYSLALMQRMRARKDMQEIQKAKAKAMNNGFPFRFSHMWLVDAPWYFAVLWGLFKWFLKAKLRERMHFIHSTSMAQCYEYVPKEALPDEFGGTLSAKELAAYNEALWDQWERDEAEGRRWS